MQSLSAPHLMGEKHPNHSHDRPFLPPLNFSTSFSLTDTTGLAVKSTFFFFLNSSLISLYVYM